MTPIHPHIPYGARNTKDLDPSGPPGPALDPWWLQPNASVVIIDAAAVVDDASSFAPVVAPVPVCCPHNDPSNYHHEAAHNRSGWVRTSCKICDRFVGYGPESKR